MAKTLEELKREEKEIQSAIAALQAEKAKGEAEIKKAEQELAVAKFAATPKPASGAGSYQEFLNLHAAECLLRLQANQATRQELYELQRRSCITTQKDIQQIKVSLRDQGLEAYQNYSPSPISENDDIESSLQKIGSMSLGTGPLPPENGQPGEEGQPGLGTQPGTEGQPGTDGQPGGEGQPGQTPADTVAAGAGGGSAGASPGSASPTAGSGEGAGPGGVYAKEHSAGEGGLGGVQGIPEASGDSVPAGQAGPGSAQGSSARSSGAGSLGGAAAGGGAAGIGAAASRGGSTEPKGEEVQRRLRSRMEQVDRDAIMPYKSPKEVLRVIPA